MGKLSFPLFILAVLLPVQGLAGAIPTPTNIATLPPGTTSAPTIVPTVTVWASGGYALPVGQAEYEPEVVALPTNIPVPTFVSERLYIPWSNTGSGPAPTNRPCGVPPCPACGDGLCEIPAESTADCPDDCSAVARLSCSIPEGLDEAATAERAVILNGSNHILWDTGGNLICSGATVNERLLGNSLLPGAQRGIMNDTSSSCALTLLTPPELGGLVPCE